MAITALFGPSAQFRRSVQAHRDSLFRLAYSWCHDAPLADDLVQDTLARALDRSAQLREPERLKGWLCAILANCLRDHLRRARHFEDIDALDESVLGHDETPERASERSQLARRVRAEIARLPLGQRQVLTLVDLESCSYAEVSEILAVPIGTVMSRLCRARAALRERLCDAAPQSTRKLRAVQ